MSDDGERCAAGYRCREYDQAKKLAALVYDNPLCADCLRVAERDINTLVYDWIDLEQLQAPSLSQAMDTQPGTHDPNPMPLAAGPEALQAEIVHTLTTWEEIVRDYCHLSAPTETRPGPAVHRAVTVIAPRVAQLATIGPTTVYPTGCEDTPTDMHGWQAVLHLSALHHRARGMLGRTRRTMTVPGTCSSCNRDNLRRDEPRHEGDPCPVYCPHCATTWTYDEYERYVMMMVWPGKDNP